MITKNRIQRLAAIAAVVLCSTSAVAAERTMFMHWIGAGPTVSASASGQITFDDVADFSSGIYHITRIFDLTLTVSGAGAGDGTFGLADFRNIIFDFPSTLDFNRELVGQPLSTGLRFGDYDPSGAGLSGSFTLCGNGGNAPECDFYFDIHTGGDRALAGPHYGLQIASISPVPEPATAMTTLIGLGVVGWRARRRWPVAHQGTQAGSHLG